MADHARLQGAKPGQLQTLSMGVDTSTQFSPDPAVSRTDNEILFVGRLVEKKGCAYLVEAMPAILRRYPSSRLSIVGSGPEQTALHRQVEHMGIAHAVTFYGAASNAEIPDWYRRATVFVAPSIVTAAGDQEGLGLVLVEALACECPVVASDLPAIRDVVMDGVNGLLCQPRDSAELAARIGYLFEHPELRRSMGRAGRQYVQSRFDWTTVSSRYAALIQELVQARA